MGFRIAIELIDNGNPKWKGDNMKSFTYDLEEQENVLKTSHAEDVVISNQLYNLLIGLITLYGLLANVVMIKLLTPYIVSINWMVFLIAYCVVGFSGNAICIKSKNPWISFLGYNMVVVPVGAVLSCCFSKTAPELIYQIFFLASAITIVMLVFATIFPKQFGDMRLGFVLFMALICLVLTELMSLIFFHEIPTIFAWIGAILYTLYIGYWWARSQSYVKTVDNAVDSALLIYLSISGLILKLRKILDE